MNVTLAPVGQPSMESEPAASSSATGVDSSTDEFRRVFDQQSASPKASKKHEPSSEDKKGLSGPTERHAADGRAQPAEHQEPAQQNDVALASVAPNDDHIGESLDISLARFGLDQSTDEIMVADAAEGLVNPTQKNELLDMWLIDDSVNLDSENSLALVDKNIGLDSHTFELMPEFVSSTGEQANPLNTAVRLQSSLVRTSTAAELESMSIKLTPSAIAGVSPVRTDADTQPLGVVDETVKLNPLSAPSLKMGNTIFGMSQQNSRNLLSNVGMENTMFEQMAPLSPSPKHAFGYAPLAESSPVSPMAGIVSSSNTVQMPVTITFGQQGWAQMVAERSALMASQNIKFAELQLDPPELGPLQVKVTVNQDQATVSFVATNTQVKEALEHTLVRLKDMLDEQGLNLADVDVSDQSSQQGEDTEDTGRREQLMDEDPEMPQHTSQQLQTHYGVDFYA